MTRYGIVVDLTRCVGCMTCVVNCKEENLTRPGIWWNRIIQVEDPDAQRITYVRHACMHCENPPCVGACANQAIVRRCDGIVVVDKEKCTGIGACVEACPYSVIELNPDQEYSAGVETRPEVALPRHRVHPPGKASMCTMCAHRVDDGLQPACVAGCPSRAMVFGDLDDPESPISRLSKTAEGLDSDADTGPEVTYIFPVGAKERIELHLTPDRPGQGA